MTAIPPAIVPTIIGIIRFLVLDCVPSLEADLELGM